MKGQKPRRSFRQWSQEERAGPLMACALTLFVSTWIAILTGRLYNGFWSIDNRPFLFLPLALVLAGCFLQQPRIWLWWSLFGGVEIKVNLGKLAVREQAGEDHYLIQEEIQAWVQKCSKRGWIRINPYAYKFRRKADAAMFKLAWG